MAGVDTDKKDEQTAEEKLAEDYAVDDLEGGPEFDEQGRDVMTGLMGADVDEDDDGPSGTGGGPFETDETGGSDDETAGGEPPAGRTAGSWSEDLLAEAQDKLGLNEKQAKALASPAALQTLLGQFDAKIAELGQSASDESGGDDADENAGETKSDKSETDAGDETDDSGVIEPFNLDLGEEGTIYPELTEPMEKMAAHFNNQLQTLHRQVIAVGEYIAERQKEAFDTEMDNLFDGLDPSWGEVFGKGPTADLIAGKGKESNEVQARLRVKEHMDAIAAGLDRIGREVPPNKTLFLQSVRALHGDKSDKIARLHIAHKLKDREGQATKPPTHREAAESTDPVKNAESAVAAKLRDFGVETREAEEEGW